MMNVFKIRSIYLLVYMAFAFWRVFYNVYLQRDLELSGSQIGTLNAIIQFSVFFVVTFWGMVADKKGIRPTLLIVVVLCGIGMYFLGEIYSYWLLLIYIPVLTIFYHPIGPLTDALSTEYAKYSGKYSFGAFRLWGSLGWAIASIVGGVLFKHDRLPLTYIFLFSAVLYMVTIPLLTTRHRKRTYKPNFQTLKLKELMGNKPLLYLAVFIVMYGITCSPVHSYLNLYFTELNTGNDMVGYAYAIMAASEIPMFILGTSLLKRWGADKIILIAVFTMLMRFVVYGFAPSPLVALLICVFQGITLPFFLVGIVHSLQQLLPEGRHATAQSLIWGLYLGVGQAFGNLFIGAILDQIGMVGVMKLFILIAFATLLFGLWYFRKLKTESMG